MSVKNKPVVISALYQFVFLNNYKQLCAHLFKICKKNGIKGSLLLAEEGINGTIAGTWAGIRATLSFLKSDPRLSSLNHKESYHSQNPFYRMKVKLKKEIVTMGVKGLDPTKIVGEYVSPQQWNDLLREKELVLIDTRNTYETAIGSFKGAIKPKLNTFRDFPAYLEKTLDPKRHKKVAMFCTGGIRCEKSTAFLKAKGFEQVYHLEGGILKYLEQIPQQESCWEGECFVFDNRVSVNHQLEKGSYDQCHGCRHPISRLHQASQHYVKGVQCPHCVGQRSQKQLARSKARQRQVELSSQKHQCHFGPQTS